MEKYITLKAAPQGKNTEKTREDTMDGQRGAKAGSYQTIPCAIAVSG